MMKPINGWTKKTILEQIKKYNNGKRAAVDGICKYLTEDNNRCFVGCFIPDNHPGLSYKGTARRLFNEFPELEKMMPLKEMSTFQAVHDVDRNDPGIDMHKASENWLNAYVEDN